MTDAETLRQAAARARQMTAAHAEPLAELLDDAARAADFNPQLSPRHRRDVSKAVAVARAVLTEPAGSP
ncbi:hypothetical protein AB0I81_39990 [Nonomuraea sp. NPDC050404]|uniref:hypothetical protein n=1 Tax=Nonomuraea sp. NPDC050404 TaxID=3155783 RepID=UPI0033F07BFB